jgi:hypothetical protein
MQVLARFQRLQAAAGCPPGKEAPRIRCFHANKRQVRRALEGACKVRTLCQHRGDREHQSKAPKDGLVCALGQDLGRVGGT